MAANLQKNGELWVPLQKKISSIVRQVNMDYLPKDPAILVSSVNMLLRDGEFDTLESVCYAFSREAKDIKDYLMKYGFVWSEHQKQFRPIGYDQWSQKTA